MKCVSHHLRAESRCSTCDHGPSVRHRQLSGAKRALGRWRAIGGTSDRRTATKYLWALATRGARQEAIILSDREIRAIKVEVLRQFAADLRRGARWSTGTAPDEVLAGLLDRRADRIAAGEMDHTGIGPEELGEAQTQLQGRPNEKDTEGVTRSAAGETPASE